ncbi:MAG: tRNA pseudouridine(38-40) synthase TruA [Clostridia bacterium]|nr:tRNA pseudouridine(38-40) synthase TruA [Clostridia bacterium]
MRRIKLVLDYVGTRYHGWQLQPGKDTVQKRLEEALSSLCKEEIHVVASGRTDSGVHAVGQVVHFDTNTAYELVAYVRGTNNYLPDNIRVLKAEEVPDDFHARFSAKRKTYVYVMYEGKEERAIYANRAIRIDKIDTKKMEEACKYLLGEHDFASFMSTGSDVKTTTRTVYRAELIQKDGTYEFYVCANGFLYNMVRKIVASLLRVGTGKMSVEEFKARVDFPDINSLPYVAPASGLYLLSVEY